MTTSYEFIEAAQAYSDLGWAVTDQFRAIIEASADPEEYASLEERGELNPNAVAMIRDWLRAYPDAFEDAAEIADAIDEYLAPSVVMGRWSNDA